MIIVSSLAARKDALFEILLSASSTAGVSFGVKPMILECGYLFATTLMFRP